MRMAGQPGDPVVSRVPARYSHDAHCSPFRLLAAGGAGSEGEGRTMATPGPFHEDDPAKDTPGPFHEDDPAKDTPGPFHEDDPAKDTPGPFHEDDPAKDTPGPFHEDDPATDTPAPSHAARAQHGQPRRPRHRAAPGRARPPAGSEAGRLDFPSLPGRPGALRPALRLLRAPQTTRAAARLRARRARSR